MGRCGFILFHENRNSYALTGNVAGEIAEPLHRSANGTLFFVPNNRFGQSGAKSGTAGSRNRPFWVALGFWVGFFY